MAERYTPFPNFDRVAIAQTLGAEIRSLRDVAHGEGDVVDVAGKAVLEVFPDAGVARVTTQDARIEVYRVPGISTDDEAGRVLFQHGGEDDRARLLVRADGNVSFYPVLRATGSPTADERRAGAPIVRPAPENGSQSATESPASNEQPDAESEDRPIITLTGRLGRDPWFKRDEDELRAGFPLAVNNMDGTIWHNVVARAEAAEQVNEGHSAGYIRKGRQVAVTGQHGESTGRGKPLFEATAVTKPVRQQSQRRAD